MYDRERTVALGIIVVANPQSDSGIFVVLASEQGPSTSHIPVLRDFSPGVGLRRFYGAR